MTMLESSLRRFLEHPKRRFIVIMITSVVALLGLWPSVDKYAGLRSQETELRGELSTIEEMVANMAGQQQIAEKRATMLGEMEKQGVSEEEARELKKKVTELVRASQCQLKRIDLINATKRKWRTKDDPLEQSTGTKSGDETPYVLVSQQLTLTISGDSANIRKLLTKLHHEDKLIHTQKLSIKPMRGIGVAEGKNEVLLEVDVLLFDLELEKKEQKSA